jgi:carboxyl-terminal processing protease
VPRSRLALARWLAGPLAAAALAACAARQPPSPYDRAVGLETFDAAWSIIDRTHFDTTFNGVDWRALREELRPRAERAATTAELRAVIRTMLDRLGQSHFLLLPREIADDTGRSVAGSVQGTVGFDARLVDGALLVWRVEPDGPAARGGVRPGWTVEVAGEDTVARVLERLRARPGRYRLETRAWGIVGSRLTGAVDSAVPFVFRDAAGRRVSLRLVYTLDRAEPVKLGNLPMMFARFESAATAAPGGGRVAVLRFNSWLPAIMRELDATVDRHRDADGMVLDLRGNGGGMGAMLGGIAGHFLDRRDTLGVMVYRGGRLLIVANPRRATADGRAVRPFAGPLAVLVDELSGSASEAFSGGMQSLGRARIFGSTSMGAVLAARFDRLPNGDVLYHSFADFITHDGTRLEARGVIPDEPVAVTRADLLAGRDPVLDAALRWIAAQPTGERP